MTQFFAAFEDLFKSIYELFASIIGTFAHAIQIVISTILNFFSGIINLFTDVFKGVVDVVGGVGSFVISKYIGILTNNTCVCCSGSSKLSDPKQQATSSSLVFSLLVMSSTHANSKASLPFLQRRPTRWLA